MKARSHAFAGQSPEGDDAHVFNGEASQETKTPRSRFNVGL